MKLKHLLNKSEVAELVGLGPKSTMKMLKEFGVEPCADFGPGRGRGPRWRTSEVLEAVYGTKPHRTTPAPRPPKRKRNHAINSATIIDDLFS